MFKKLIKSSYKSQKFNTHKPLINSLLNSIFANQNLEMRLHRNLVYTTIDGLNAIFNEKEYADKVVARSLKKDKRWGSSDRKFVAETLYEVVRWKRLYSEIAEVKEPFNRDDLWRMFSVWAVLRGYPIPEIGRASCRERVLMPV